MAVKIEKWVLAQKKHKLSDKHVQMARELGLNPDKLGKIDNHKQETWKAPLPQFIENIYIKRFKKEKPVTVRSLKDIIADDKARKEKKKKEWQLDGSIQSKVMAMVFSMASEIERDLISKRTKEALQTKKQAE